MATFNARAEMVETKPVFRDAFRRTRCLIPMSGYYEWQATAGGKQLGYFTAADGSPPLTAAGLWDEWKDHAILVLAAFALATLSRLRTGAFLTYIFVIAPLALGPFLTAFLIPKTSAFGP